MRTFRLFLTGCLLLFPLSAATFYLTVAGLGGEQDYEQRFVMWANDIDKAVRTEAGAVVITLSGAEATRANIETRLKEFSRDAKPDDVLVVMLIGHGSFDGTEYKFNVVGPDISAIELAALLNRIPAQRQAVINMTSASGGALDALQREKRVVITATKSGTEKNATLFARFWVEALRDSAADTDKNEVISVLEAFKAAEQKTAKFYETQNRLATEHPLFEDTGHGEGVRQPSPQNGQGLVAGRFPLLRIGAAQAISRDPAKAELLKKREQLELAIDQLKYNKAGMPSAEYKRALSALLVDLAKLQEEIDK